MNASELKNLNQNEHTLKALNLIEKNATPTQREMAKGLHLSLGKINFVIKALIQQGLIKVERFKNSRKKSAYLYYLTSEGFERKLTLTKNFLNRKLNEFESLKKEINRLKQDLEEKTEIQK